MASKCKLSRANDGPKAKRFTTDDLDEYTEPHSDFVTGAHVCPARPKTGNKRKQKQPSECDEIDEYFEMPPSFSSASEVPAKTKANKGISHTYLSTTLTLAKDCKGVSLSTKSVKAILDDDCFASAIDNSNDFTFNELPPKMENELESEPHNTIAVGFLY